MNVYRSVINSRSMLVVVIVYRTVKVISVVVLIICKLTVIMNIVISGTSMIHKQGHIIVE